MIVTVGFCCPLKFVVAWVTLLAFDALWLSFATWKIEAYATMSKGVTTLNGVAAVLLYTCVASAAASTLDFHASKDASVFGAFAGGVIFASYNITTLAVDARWTRFGAAVDTLYGVISWCTMLTVAWMA